MNKFTIITTVFVLALVASCAPQAPTDGQGPPQQNGKEIPDTATFELLRFGAFAPQDRVKELITVTPEKVVYKRFNHEGETSLDVEEDITRQQYNSLLTVFRDAGFMDLDSMIEPDVNIEDVGEANITASWNGNQKTVNIDPFYQEELSQELNNIIEEFSNFHRMAIDLSQEQARNMAREFVKNTPTYKFDGSDLKRVDHVVLESYPTQHVVTYNFTSSHGGYGNRSGQMITQVITPHQIVVKIQDARVSSAVIDGQWNSLTQQMVRDESEDDTGTGNPPLLQMVYQPEQCEQTPWDEWYAEGNANFVKEPTDEELIQAYYSDKGVGIRGVQKMEPDRMVCQACGCPTSHYFTAQFEMGNEDELEEDGWRSPSDEPVSN